MSRLWPWLLAVVAASASAAPDYVVKSSCSDGQAHGSYELRDAQGGVRVVGAFNRGKRMGSFLFWTSAGVRVAHLPFEEDVLSGTVAVWHGAPGLSGESRIKLEATYVQGARNGATRSWYPDGRVRAEYRYERGALASARAFSEKGSSLPEAEARAMAARDGAEDQALFAALTALVAEHLPRCEPASDRLEKG